MFFSFFLKKIWLIFKMIFSYSSFQNFYFKIFNFFFYLFNFVIYLILLTIIVSLGDFEVFFNFFSVLILGLIVYNIINCFSFKNLIHKFGFNKINKRDFYECGFKPQTQKPIKLPIQFLLICIFFLLYDIELIFLFPYVSGIMFAGLYDFFLIIFFFILFFFSLLIDYERHALYWQY